MGSIDSIGSLGGTSELETLVGSIVAILFLLSQVAYRIAQLVPGKRDDEITSKIELILRSVVDFMAGKHGKPGDPTLRK